MKELQALMSAIGRKRAIVLLIMLGINLAMAGMWQKVLLPQQDQLTMDASKAQSERSKLQTQIRELPAKHAALEQNEKRYEDLLKQGVFKPQDRIEARSLMDVLRQQAGIRNISYKIEPQTVVDNPTLMPTNNQIVLSPMSVDMLGMTDHEVMHFVDKMLTGFNGLVVLKTFKIERKDELNSLGLQRLKNGDPVDFVSASATFDWYSITPKTNEKDSPLAQAFQGSTP